MSRANVESASGKGNEVRLRASSASAASIGMAAVAPCGSTLLPTQVGFTKCAATIKTEYSGSAKLRVGKLKGKLDLHLSFAPVPPDFSPPKSGSGTASNPQGSEGIRVKGSGLPTKRGVRFGVILNTRVLPPPDKLAAPVP